MRARLRGGRRDATGERMSTIVEFDRDYCVIVRKASGADVVFGCYAARAAAVGAVERLAHLGMPARVVIARKGTLVPGATYEPPQRTDCD